MHGRLGRRMALWMGQDGFDYAFQADCQRMRNATIAAYAEMADYDPARDISVEY